MDDKDKRILELCDELERTQNLNRQMLEALRTFANLKLNEKGEATITMFEVRHARAVINQVTGR